MSYWSYLCLGQDTISFLATQSLPELCIVKALLVANVLSTSQFNFPAKMSDASAIVGTPQAPDIYLPSFASYNWIGSPSNYDLTTNAATGGDSDLENVNKWFQSGDQAYIIVASAMVSQNLGYIPLKLLQF